MNPILHSLHIYPVKSCGAIDVASAFASKRGLKVGRILDRSWIIADNKNVFISQRRRPELACIKPKIIADQICLEVNGMPPMMFDPAQAGHEKRQINIHGKDVVASVGPATVSAWFSDYLGEPVQAFYQKDEDIRLCHPDFSLVAGQDAVSFADGFPYLVTGTATLDKLNQTLDQSVPMTRFRPNFVIATSHADEEYRWQDIMIGTIPMRCVKPCTRCVMTTIDQNSGDKTGPEPLATLARDYFLRHEINGQRVQGAVFGENVIIKSEGMIHVGDRVTVQATKPAYGFGRTNTG